MPELSRWSCSMQLCQHIKQTSVAWENTARTPVPEDEVNSRCIYCPHSFFSGSWRCQQHSGVHTTLFPEGCEQSAHGLQPGCNPGLGFLFQMQILPLQTRPVLMDWSTEICQPTYRRAECYHFHCVERVKLVLYPLKRTFLKDILGWKDKKLPETSKHYFKSTHPFFHTKGRDNLQHWSSHTALLISSLTAWLELSDGTTWSLLYIPA